MQSYVEFLKGMDVGWYEVGTVGWKQKEERRRNAGMCEKLGGTSIERRLKGNSSWAVCHL